MTTVLYRLNGGEVEKISATNQQFDQRDTSYWGVATDPAFPDGTDLERRVLGSAKILDGATCRNATQPEIDGFPAAQAADENLMDRDRARDLFLNHPNWRKMMVAYSSIIKDEINILRLWTHDFQEEVANATSLADLKTRVAALPTLHDRTLSQLKTAINNRISEND